MKYDVFISYRREGGYDAARLIYDRLKMDKYRVHFDLDTLRNGDFDEALYQRIDECKDFVIILNKGVFDRCFTTPKEDDKRIQASEYDISISKAFPFMLKEYERSKK
jgi:hypothetical protein